jgi:hypothetical protein
MPDFEDFGREISKIWPKKLFRTAPLLAIIAKIPGGQKFRAKF